MLTGNPPFQSDSPHKVYAMIMFDKVEIPKTITSPETRDILQRLLERDPGNNTCGFSN